MKTVRVSWLVPLVSLLMASIVGVAATVDHRHKQGVINNAQVADYFCRTQHTRCGGVSWQRIEARWQSRQLAYEFVVIAFAGVGLMPAAYRVAQRFRSRAGRSSSHPRPPS